MAPGATRNEAILPFSASCPCPETMNCGGLSAGLSRMKKPAKPRAYLYVLALVGDHSHSLVNEPKKNSDFSA